MKIMDGRSRWMGEDGRVTFETYEDNDEALEERAVAEWIWWRTSDSILGMISRIRDLRLNLII